MQTAGPQQRRRGAKESSSDFKLSSELGLRSPLKGEFHITKIQKSTFNVRMIFSKKVAEVPMAGL